MRKVSGGIITTTGTFNADGLAVDKTGAVYLAQGSYGRIQEIDANGNLSVPIGDGTGH